jgi:hypothetical protein
MADPPTGSELPNTIRIAAAELVAPCEELRALLFEEPLDVVPVGDIERSPRWLIQFVVADRVRELIASISALPPSDYLTLARYLSQWLTDVRLNLRQSTWIDAGEYFVDLPGDSPRNKTTFDQWSDRIRALSRRFETAAEWTVDGAAVSEIASAATRVLEEVEKTAGNVKDAAGEVGTNKLASHFAVVAAQERVSARLWTGLAATSLAGVTGIAFKTLDVGASPSEDWKIQALHLSLTLPFAALAAYASRAASRHRQQSWWARSSAAQLHAITTYVEPLDDDSRSLLLVQVGQRVFAQPAVNMSAQEPDAASLAASVDGLVSTMRDKKEQS